MYFSKRIRSLSGFLPILGQKLHTERSKHSGSAVICCTSADSNDEFAASARNGIPYHLAHSIGGGFSRISLRLLHKCNTRGLRHLHNRCLFIRKDSVVSFYPASHRSRHRQFHFPSAQPLYQGICCALSSVCQGADRHIGMRIDAQHPVTRRIPRFHGSHTPLKRIDQNHYIHLFLLTGMQRRHFAMLTLQCLFSFLSTVL